MSQAEQALSDADMIAQNLCPVCKVPRHARQGPRRALQEHIKSSRDAEHIMWREANYADHFKHGGSRCATGKTDEDVMRAVRKAFGEEVASRITIQ